MKTKTCISEIKEVVKTSLDAMVSFKDNELFFECEDLVYEIIIIHLKSTIGLELDKAKKLIHGN